MSEAGDDRARWAELFEIAPPPEAAEQESRRRGLFSRFKESLTRPRQAISPQLAGVFAPGLITRETWDELEEALIAADCGMDAALALVEELREEAQQGRIVNRSEIAAGLAAAGSRQMAPEPPRIPLVGAPTVILVVGVNGSGKTTTVGKLAHRLSDLGQQVVIGAADTFVRRRSTSWRFGPIGPARSWCARGPVPTLVRSRSMRSRPGPHAEPTWC